jgi:hypothetical protein
MMRFVGRQHTSLSTAKLRFSKITCFRDNLENVQIVGAMLRILHSYCVPSMSRKVEIITPYAEQAKLYKAMFLSMRKRGMTE